MYERTLAEYEKSVKGIDTHGWEYIQNVCLVRYIIVGVVMTWDTTKRKKSVFVVF
jgi:hypothetical protein